MIHNEKIMDLLHAVLTHVKSFELIFFDAA
jgi:hypothetical protein